MKLKPIIDQIQFEADVIKGDESKAMTYSSQHTYPDETSAREAFNRSVDKLLAINDWSGLSNFTADFVLCDQAGKPKSGSQPQVGDYINVILPGPMPENWVTIVQMDATDTRVEFTVQPSHDPRKKGSEEVEHFFHEGARSLFRVELDGMTIKASEIGRNEGINNKGPQAGDRSLINTVIAEGGWLFYQKLQWKSLTDYLVHLPDNA